MGPIIVIFRAHARTQDENYRATALRMRDKAIAEYGCTEFVFAVTPDGEEVALSYWPDEASITRWKHDLKHQAARTGTRVIGCRSPRSDVITASRYDYDRARDQQKPGTDHDFRLGNRGLSPVFDRRSRGLRTIRSRCRRSATLTLV